MALKCKAQETWEPGNQFTDLENKHKLHPHFEESAYMSPTPIWKGTLTGQMIIHQRLQQTGMELS